ncbi:MAG: hypothetical protein ACR2LL_07875 [Nitrosopumilus sp.]
MEKLHSKLFLFAAIGLIAISYNVNAFAEDEGVIEFLEDSYSYDGTAVIRVTDSDMDVSNGVDTVDAVVSSDADTVGTTIMLHETDSSSGVFEGTVFFVLDDYTSGHRLQIVQGGEIYATYKDMTSSASIEGTPSPITDTTELEEISVDSNDLVVPSVTLDRDVYPVPFGGFDEFEDTGSFAPDGRSLFPIHTTAIHKASTQEPKDLPSGDLILHIRINDANFDVSPQNEDEISQDVNGQTVGPLKISISRDSQKVVLGYAGGSTQNENGLIDVGDDSPATARHLGPISEIAPDAGIFELDYVLRYTDGPANPKCPATAVFVSLNDDDAGLLQGSEESKFDLSSPENENYCIMKGDILTVEYTSLDSSGDLKVVTDSATFDLRDGKIESDKSTYDIGSDMILTLTDPDLDLDNDAAETYTLDLIEWDSDAATISMGILGGEITAFDPEPTNFRETGDSTGIFQIVVAIPEVLQRDMLENGEEIVLEYSDWSSSESDYVGENEWKTNLTIYTSEKSPVDMSPSQQIKQGISINEVTCMDGQHKLFIKDNTKPLCLKQETYDMLVARGYF